jgi:hypothetical protein
MPEQPPSHPSSHGLGHREFDDLIAAGCRSCSGQFLRAWALLPGSLAISAGEPVSSVRWSYERDDIHDLVYRVECRDCAAVLYERSDCPKCTGAGALERVLARPNGLLPPPRCPLCDDEELRVAADIRAYHEFLHGHFSRRVCAAALGEPGFQIHKIDCLSCEETVATAGHACTACGRSSLLKKVR